MNNFRNNLYNTNLKNIDKNLKNFIAHTKADSMKRKNQIRNNNVNPNIK